jgi:uncharacterized protein (TIGR02145 family)
MKEAYEDKVVYPSVKINNQVWMAENLNLAHFRNGEPIPEVRSEEEWLQAGEQGKPAWCYYDNDPENGKKYGKLYNYFAVTDPRGLAPDGWHVGSYKEWMELVESVELHKGAGGGLKSKTGWEENGNGADKFGFSALPAGKRTPGGGFAYIGFEGRWWSSTWRRLLILDEVDEMVCGDHNSEAYGFSVRCVKDIE